MWKCKQGKTILIPSGSNKLQRHLFVLLIEPTKINGYGSKPHVLVVNASSLRDRNPNPDCVLQVEEHPFIKHPSFIDFRYAHMLSAEHIETQVAKHFYVPHVDCSVELLRKIILAGRASKSIPKEFKNILQNTKLP